MRSTSTWYEDQTDTITTTQLRWISLIKTEVKIFNKILAKHVKRVLHHDQVGFIPGMKLSFNIYKSLDVLCHTKILKNKNHTVISIDAEKAYWHMFWHTFRIKNWYGVNIHQHKLYMTNPQPTTYTKVKSWKVFI